jgi:hypothetical protein
MGCVHEWIGVVTADGRKFVVCKWCKCDKQKYMEEINGIDGLEKELDRRARIIGDLITDKATIAIEKDNLKKELDEARKELDEARKELYEARKENNKMYLDYLWEVEKARIERDKAKREVFILSQKDQTVASEAIKEQQKEVCDKGCDIWKLKTDILHEKLVRVTAERDEARKILTDIIEAGRGEK